MRNEIEVNRAIDLYADTVRRICFMHLKNYADVEDIFQDVFLKYVLHEASFASDDHEKAWLIRVSINECKDLLKSYFRKKVVSLEDMFDDPVYFPEEDKEVFEAVFKLPQNYRNVIYLFYAEGYSAVEIAKILKKPENTIYTWLDRGRKELKVQLGGDPLER